MNGHPAKEKMCQTDDCVVGNGKLVLLSSPNNNDYPHESEGLTLVKQCLRSRLPLLVIRRRRLPSILSCR